MDWLLISWTSRLTGLLNLSRYHCYHHLDLSMIKDFYGFVMFSLSLSNSVQQRQRNFTKDADQKMFISWQTYEGLKISFNSVIESTQFLLWHQFKYVLTERFCQDTLENWFGRQRSLGLRKDNPSMVLDITIMLSETNKFQTNR